MTGTLKPLPAVCKLVTGGTEPKKYISSSKNMSIDQDVLTTISIL